MTQDKAPADIPGRFRGHAYRLASHRKQRQIIDNGVMLIGDAAGLAYPQSGEGIYTAIKSGLLAATTAIEANGNYHLSKLENYSARLDKFYGREAAFANISIPSVLRGTLAQFLLKNHYFSRHVLLDKWFLHQDGNVSM